MVQVKSNLIFLGPQGSGKSTQAKEFCEKFNYKLISMGLILRKIASKNTKFAKTIKKYINIGKLVPSKIIFEKILYPKLMNIKQKTGIIFDGIPRNIFQLKKFNDSLTSLNITQPYLVYFDLSINKSFERVKNRKICPKCENIYQINSKSYINNMCIYCKKSLISRKDDKNQNIIKRRFAIFLNQTKKIIDYYKKNNLFIRIDASKSIKTVNSELIHKIKLINE